MLFLACLPESSAESRILRVKITGSTEMESKAEQEPTEREPQETDESVRLCSSLYELMNSSFCFETINFGWSSVYIEGSQLVISK